MISFKDDMVGDIGRTYLSVKFELRKHLRRRRLLITAALAVFLPALFYVIPELFGTGFPDTANAFASSNLGFINLLIILSGAIFAGDAISGEFEKKTGLMLFSAPHRRTTVFVGKYLAALIATWSAVLLYYAVTALEVAVKYGVTEISMGFVKSFLLALIYAASVVSLIFFFSSILKRTITSTLVGFFFLMMILPIMSSVLRLVEVESWFLVTYSAGLITDVFGLPSGPAMGPGARFNIVLFEPDFYLGITVMAAYAIILFLASIAIANRKEVR